MDILWDVHWVTGHMASDCQPYGPPWLRRNLLTFTLLVANFTIQNAAENPER